MKKKEREREKERNRKKERERNRKKKRVFGRMQPNRNVYVHRIRHVT